MASNESLIRSAIEGKSPVSFHYQGYYREACPHCLGWKKDAAVVLVYQFGGEGSQGPVVELTERNWRVMKLGEIEGLKIADGTWQTHASYCGPGKKQFDVVDVFVPY